MLWQLLYGTSCTLHSIELVLFYPDPIGVGRYQRCRYWKQGPTFEALKLYWQWCICCPMTCFCLYSFPPNFIFPWFQFLFGCKTFPWWKMCSPIVRLQKWFAYLIMDRNPCFLPSENENCVKISTWNRDCSEIIFVFCESLFILILLVLKYILWNGIRALCWTDAKETWLNLIRTHPYGRNK